MNNDELVEWIIENGKYLLTLKGTRLKINLYELQGEYWEIYFDTEDNEVSRVNKVNSENLKKYLGVIDLPPLK